MATKAETNPARRVASAKANVEAEEKERIAKERTDFKGDRWAKSSPLIRFAARLALMVENRDADLSADIRACIAASDDGADYPKGNWWTGLDRPVSPAAQKASEEEAEKVAVAKLVVEKIPAEWRILYRIRYGENPVAIAEAWTAQQEANTKPRAA